MSSSSPLSVLVAKILKCEFAPVSSEDEPLIRKMISKPENINKVLGKEPSIEDSATLIYYMAMCHLKEKRTVELEAFGVELLGQAADFGCPTAWWELFRRVPDRDDLIIKKMTFLINGYEKDQPSCVKYVHENLKTVIIDLAAFIPAIGDGGTFVKSFATLASKCKSIECEIFLEMMLYPAWTSVVEIPEEDKEAILEILESHLGDSKELLNEIANAYDISLPIPLSSPDEDEVSASIEAEVEDEAMASASIEAEAETGERAMEQSSL